MSPALQNRLVGTIILVALSVIFLPDILDGEKQSNQDIFVDLPKRPEVKPIPKLAPFPSDEVKAATQQAVETLTEVPVDAPELAEDIKQTQPEEQAQNQSAEALTDVLMSAPQPDVEPVKAGWVVQLGVFRHQKNVRELLDKLKAAGYRAFSRKVQTSSGELNKVFVGPDLQKDKLESALPHLNEITQLQGRITPFTVN